MNQPFITSRGVKVGDRIRICMNAREHWRPAFIEKSYVTVSGFTAAGWPTSNDMRSSPRSIRSWIRVK
jgi:hypothetical protein